MLKLQKILVVFFSLFLVGCTATTKEQKKEKKTPIIHQQPKVKKESSLKINLPKIPNYAWRLKESFQENYGENGKLTAPHNKYINGELMGRRVAGRVAMVCKKAKGRDLIYRWRLKTILKIRCMPCKKARRITLQLLRLQSRVSFLGAMQKKFEKIDMTRYPQKDWGTIISHKIRLRSLAEWVGQIRSERRLWLRAMRLANCPLPPNLP